MSWHHFFFSKGIRTGKAEVVTSQVDSVSFSEKEPIVAQSAIPSQRGAVAVLPQEQEMEKITLPEGKTLRLLALDIFGDREFWVYIYLENKDKIPNPNKVPAGTVLVLPDRSVYSINAADPHSVAKAKSLGNEVLMRF